MRDVVGLLGVSLEAPRVAFSHARRGWWRRLPPLPIPSRTHVAWRVAAAYGTAETRPSAHDIVEFVAWRRRHRRALR